VTLASELEKGPLGSEVFHGSKGTATDKTEGDAKHAEPIEPLDKTTTEYLQGLHLTIVIMSLMLSIFLVSLDNVSTCVSTVEASANFPARPLLGRQSQRLPTSSMASTKCRGMNQHTL
jgi:hypothetical protein